MRRDAAVLTGTENTTNGSRKRMNSRMTGHSLGGQITKHVNNLHKGRVKKNVVFSRGTGLLEPFRNKQNIVDMSNQHDLKSLGARLQGGNQVVETKHEGLLELHNLGVLFH